MRSTLLVEVLARKSATTAKLFAHKCARRDVSASQVILASAASAFPTITVPPILKRSRLAIETKFTPNVEIPARKSAQTDPSLAHQNVRWAVSANQDILAFEASVFRRPIVRVHRCRSARAAMRSTRIVEAPAPNNVAAATQFVHMLAMLAVSANTDTLGFMANAFHRLNAPYHKTHSVAATTRNI